MNLLAVGCLVLAVLQVPQAPAGTPAAATSFAEAVASYRAGRYAEAHAGFQSQLAVAGAAAGSELLGNAALAALRLQRPGDAEPAAQRLTALLDPESRALGAFLLGHAAFQRCQTAVAAAKLQDAEPGAWAGAERAVGLAIEQWLAADAARGGWPEAVRNAERAAQLRAEVQAQRQAAERNRPPPKQEPDQPEPKPAPRPETTPEEQVPEPVQTKLSNQDLARLLERLQQKDREKRLARQAQQRALAVTGERDW